MGTTVIAGIFPGLDKREYEKILSANINKGVTRREKKKDEDKFRGNPGEVNVSALDGGRTICLTEIGKDGRAIVERNLTDHGKPKVHTNPHDHKITWDKNGKMERSEPINYRDGNVPKLGKEKKK